MSPEQCKVHEFHQKHSIPSGLCSRYKEEVGSEFEQLRREILFHRVRLIIEETAEFCSAVSRDHTVDMVDALADLLYVVYGAADQIGVNLEPVFNEVHRSNMTKQGATGLKVTKGEKYQGPELLPILREQGLI